MLLVDLDAQEKLTMSLGWNSPDEAEVTIATLLNKTANEEEIGFNEGILECSEGVDLIPASVQLSGYEANLLNE